MDAGEGLPRCGDSTSQGREPVESRFSTCFSLCDVSGPRDEDKVGERDWSQAWQLQQVGSFVFSPGHLIRSRFDSGPQVDLSNSHLCLHSRFLTSCPRDTYTLELASQLAPCLVILTSSTETRAPSDSPSSLLLPCELYQLGSADWTYEMLAQDVNPLQLHSPPLLHRHSLLSAGPPCSSPTAAAEVALGKGSPYPPHWVEWLVIRVLLAWVQEK